MDEPHEPTAQPGPEAEPEPATASTPQEEGPQKGEGKEKQAGEAPKEAVPLDVYSLLNYALALMRDYAWQAMGLVPNAGTGKIERNLEQAQIAIDTAAFLADKLEPHLPEKDRPHLRSMVRDLKINYVRQRSQE